MERVKGKCLNFISTQILYLYQPKRSSSVTDKAARTFDFNNSSNSCGQIKMFHLQQEQVKALRMKNSYQTV